jgi:hypothetical protein
MMFNNGLPDLSLFCCISLLCLPHCLSAHITCVVCSSAFYSSTIYTLCTMSLQCNLPLLCICAPALCLLAHTSILLHSDHNNSNNNNNPSLLYTVYIYRFYASSACNIFHSYACSYRANLLHLLSALRDHHHNSSASLAVFPHVQHHWMLC